MNGTFILCCMLHEGTRGAMDTVEIPSHFMENFVYDARTLQLFMKGQKDANTGGKHAKALAQQVKEDRHILGALDLELQVRPRLHPAAYLQSMAGSCCMRLSHGASFQGAF